MEKDTHLIFNEKGIFISPNIRPVFNFLMDIEKETESFLSFDKRLEEVKNHYLEMLECVSYLGNKLKENNIDFKYNFKKDPKEIASKFDFNLPLRSQMVVLFANLEVLFTLHTSYEFEITDEEEIKKLTMDKKQIKKFLNSFVVTDENQHYKNNKARLKKVDANKLRNLRNSLTHFFSLEDSGISLSSSSLKDKSRKFENILKQNKKGNIIFLSEEDMHALIKEATIIRLKRWSEDFHTDADLFKQKIQCVIDLVNKKAPVAVANKDLKF